MKNNKKIHPSFFVGLGVGMVCMLLIFLVVYLIGGNKNQDTIVASNQQVQIQENEINSLELDSDDDNATTAMENEIYSDSSTEGEETVVVDEEETVNTVTSSSIMEESFPEETQKTETKEPESTQPVVANTSNYVEWNATTAYTGGNEVYFNGGIFKAKWWTQGEEPTRDGGSVWEYLGDLPETGMEAAEPQEGYDTSTTVKREISDGDFKVVAYYPSWKEGQKNLDKLRFDIITHVNYAFAIPTSDGGLRPLEHPELAKAVIEKAHQSGAKAILAVGGWSYNDTPLEPTFMEATSSDEKIQKFGDAILKMCNDYGFDGVDMDWEHPRVDGSSSKQYEKLMVYLADQLHAKSKILTSAVLSGVTADGLVYYDSAAHTNTVLNVVDWLNVMAYDGGDGERHSGYDFAVNCGTYWSKTRKLDPSKVVLGVPFYGRPSWASYEDFLKANPDAANGDVTTFNGMEAHYNGPATIRKKTDYALGNLGGVMIWEITHDTLDQDKSLLSAIGQSIEEAKK